MNRILAYGIGGTIVFFVLASLYGAIFAPPNDASYVTYQVTEINAGVQNFPNGCTAFGVGCIVIGDQSVAVSVGTESGQMGVQGSNGTYQGYTQVPASGEKMGLEDLLTANPLFWVAVVLLVFFAVRSRQRGTEQK